jgi:1-deoxy-D-xylulose-5-phosphate reductoisomerase
MSPPDLERYPCLRIARQAAKTGGTAPAVFNAANEIAVEAFVAGKLAFTGIAPLIEKTLNLCSSREPSSLDDVLNADAEARAMASKLAPGFAR